MKRLAFRWKPVDNAKLAEKYPLLKGQLSFSSISDKTGDSKLSYNAPRESDERTYKAQSNIQAGEVQNDQIFEAKEWSLNWNEVLPNIVLGSCPRTPQDVDRLVCEVAPDSILNLQSDACLTTLQIPFGSIHERAVECGIYLERVPIHSSDQGDQAFMLPEAVRVLNMLLARGFKVYVHCTSGLAYSGLILVGYLTFVQGMSFEYALNMVKSARQVADYSFLDCWSEARRRLLDGRKRQVQAAATGAFESRNPVCPPVSLRADYEAAQKQVIATTFGRWLELDLGVIQAELDVLNSQHAFTIRKVTAEFKKDFTMGEVHLSNSNITQDHAFGTFGPEADTTYPELGTNKEQTLLSQLDENESGWQSGESFSFSGSSDEGILLAFRNSETGKSRISGNNIT